MGRRQINTIGDLLIAAYKIGIDDFDELVRIGEMLSLRLRPSQSRSRSNESPKSSPDQPIVPPRNAQDDIEEALAPAADEMFDPSDDAWIESQLQKQLGSQELGLEAQPFPQEEVRLHHKAPQIPSLFQPQWTRAILRAALETTSLLGDVEVERLVDDLSRGEVISNLPRQPVNTLWRGAQLLCDVGTSMQPFAHDVWSMAESVERLFTPELLQVLIFDGTPIGGVGDVDEAPFEDYQPPRPGTPVLALSDFGACRGPQQARFGGAEDWLRFARIVTEAHCPLIGFCPYQLSRVPQVLRQAFTFIRWDRTTTTGQILGKREQFR